jgi:hypothetical protein
MAHSTNTQEICPPGNEKYELAMSAIGDFPSGEMLEMLSATRRLYPLATSPNGWWCSDHCTHILNTLNTKDWLLPRTLSTPRVQLAHWLLSKQY